MCWDDGGAQAVSLQVYFSRWGCCVHRSDSEPTKTSELGPKNVRSRSSDGQHHPLPLRPPPLPLLQFPRGLREERDLLFALDLPLEELQRRAVEAHHVLAGSGGGDEEERRRGGGDITDTHSDLAHLGHGVGAQLVHDRQQHLVTGDLTEMDPGRSPSPG